MKLRTPDLIAVPFERELGDDYRYLAGGKPPTLKFACKAGGYLNPALQDAMEQIAVTRKAAQMEIMDLEGEAKAKATNDLYSRLGAARFSAIYDHCIESWETNIIDDETSQPLKADADSFMLLATAEIPDISKAFLELASHVESLSQFIRKDDEETEKN